MPKKILVFGATGMVGKQIVKELLKHGNVVAVYIRQVSYAIGSVKVIQGGLDEHKKIVDTMRHYDVIISAVGNRDYGSPEQVVTPFIKIVTDHIRPDQRFIVVAGSGLTLSSFNTLRRDLPGQPDHLKNQRADHWDAYCHIAPLDINYLMVCPTMMVDGDADNNYLSRDVYFPEGGAKKVLAGNVAHFIALETMEEKFNRTRIGLADKN